MEKSVYETVPSLEFGDAMEFSEGIARYYCDECVLTHQLFRAVCLVSIGTAVGSIWEEREFALHYGKVAHVLHWFSVREFDVLNIKKGANPKLEGKVERVKWVKPRGDCEEPPLTLQPLMELFQSREFTFDAKKSNLLPPGTRTAEMVYLSVLFKDLISEPYLDLNHFMLALLHTCTKQTAFFNGQLLMNSLFGYTSYEKIAALRARILLLALDNADRRLQELTGDKEATLGEGLISRERRFTIDYPQSKEEGVDPELFPVYKVNPEFEPKGVELEALFSFGEDLTEKALAGDLPSVVGRESEVDEVLRVLCRKGKPNPLLIGSPGVGKTAIAEALALRLVKTEVPALLDGVRLISIDVQKMLAGSKYRGEMEGRVLSMVREIRGRKDILLFVDEIHAFLCSGGGGMSAEGGSGSIGVGDQLKPYLARGEIRVVGATTLAEYKKYIEVDTALARRFRVVHVGEPSISDAIHIVSQVAIGFEKHYGLVVSAGAVQAAVKLSDRYVHERFLPDKAIDLLDEACSVVFFKRERSRPVSQERRIRVMHEYALQMWERAAHKVYWAGYGYEEVIDPSYPDEKTTTWFPELSLEEELSLRLLMAELDAKCYFLEAEMALLAQKRQVLEKTKKAEATLTLTLGGDDVASVVSSWCGVPVETMTDDEGERYCDLEAVLHARVIGQDEAVVAVSAALRRARLNLGASSRPAGSFIFAGPSGTGKTELAKTVAEFMFGTEGAMVRLDMSEYSQEYNVSKLIGSPPGYVGYGEGGRLTEAVRAQPYCVVLLDEIEKAATKVYDILLQVLDDGRLTDGSGKLVDFANTILIMTSNLGTGEILTQYGSKISGGQFKATPEVRAGMEAIVRDELSRKEFRPEFLNRLDGVIVFDYLTEEDLRKILSIFVASFKRRLSEGHGVLFDLLPSAFSFILKQGVAGCDMGARPLRRAVDSLTEAGISEALLGGSISHGDYVFGYYDAEIKKLKVVSAKAVEEVSMLEEDKEWARGIFNRVGAGSRIPVESEDMNGKEEEELVLPPDWESCLIGGTEDSVIDIENI